MRLTVSRLRLTLHIFSLSPSSLKYFIRCPLLLSHLCCLRLQCIYILLTSVASQPGDQMSQSYYPSRLTLLVFSVIFSHFGLIFAQKCYYPDQTTIASGYTPCNTSAIEQGGDTTCCGVGAACLTSGLCYLMYDMSINIGACTDSSWTSPNCFQKCPSGTSCHLLNSSIHGGCSRYMVDRLLC